MPDAQATSILYPLIQISYQFGFCTKPSTYILHPTTIQEYEQNGGFTCVLISSFAMIFYFLNFLSLPEQRQHTKCPCIINNSRDECNVHAPAPVLHTATTNIPIHLFTYVQIHEQQVCTRLHSICYAVYPIFRIVLFGCYSTTALHTTILLPYFIIYYKNKSYIEHFVTIFYLCQFSV